MCATSHHWKKKKEALWATAKEREEGKWTGARWWCASTARFDEQR